MIMASDLLFVLDMNVKNPPMAKKYTDIIDAFNLCKSISVHILSIFKPYPYVLGRINILF